MSEIYLNKLSADNANWLSVRQSLVSSNIANAKTSGYKALDYYSLYGVDVLGMNEVEAAQFVSNASYLRAVAAIGAGFIV